MISKAAFLLVLLAVSNCGVIDLPVPNIQAPSFSWCAPQTQCCDSNTITVNGAATIQATPDITLLSASISENADTAALAISALAADVASIIKILTSNGLTSSNYQSSNFNLYPNTSYDGGVSKVVGQIASESFQITVPNANGVNLGKLIDALASVNGIVLNGLTFDIANKTSVYQQARKQAFQNAQTKAKDYGAALNLTVGSLLNVIDSFSAPAVYQPRREVMYATSAMKINTDTQVNVGTISISYNVQSVYALN